MLYLVLLVFEIALLYLLMRKLLQKIFHRLGMRLFSILFLPGTFVHEMSHFLTALFLLVPVGQIELMPQRVEGGVKMGSVPIGKTDPIRRTLIGISPVIFGLVIIFITTTLNIPLLLHVYIAFIIGNTMFSSKKDLEGSLISVVIVSIVFIIIYLAGIRVQIPFNWDLVQKVDAFLFVPIAIDSVFLMWR